MGKIILLIIIGYFSYQYLLGDKLGCDKYASKYSCGYVESKASYDVYYRHNLQSKSSERYIGSTVGLSACRDFAVNYANSINTHWNNRAYICVLMDDGNSVEKHRL